MQTQSQQAKEKATVQLRAGKYIAHMGRILFFFWLLMLLTSLFSKTEIPILLSLAIWIFELRRFKMERIIVDRESVTQLSPFGKRQVFFEEIQAIETSLERDTLVTHSGERPIHWRHSLANVAELRDEINKHLFAKNNQADGEN